MIDASPPWADSGSLRAPTAQELALGFQCGPADPALFNYLFRQLYGEVGHVIDAAGLSPDGDDLTQLYQALRRMGPPPGSVTWFSASAPPAGWLVCNGALVSRTAYADLFAVIGSTFGPGDGGTTFALPDLRGEFIRGWDGGRGIDAGRVFGSWQAGAIQSHTHATYDLLVSATSGAGANASSGALGGASGATGGTETRPRNVALLPIIKY